MAAASAPLVEWLSGLPAPVRVAYEAGPTGFGLARACAEAGIACLVAAPGKIPRAAVERVKTDRRDAERLARLLRLGELTTVRVPSELEEAGRDLVRAREDARADLMRARHRLSKLLLRHGLLWERTAWTGEHDRWLRRLRFAGVSAVCFDESYGTVLQTKARDRLDEAIIELAGAPWYADVVARLCWSGTTVRNFREPSCRLARTNRRSHRHRHRRKHRCPRRRDRECARPAEQGQRGVERPHQGLNRG